jgi:GNAT superfamily N-acetyltransferase
MSVVIRRACDSDTGFLSRSIGELQAMHAAAMPALFKSTAEPYLPQRLTDLLSNPASYLFVADVDGGPVGFTHLWIVTEPEGENNFANMKIFISYVYVQAENRYKGIGKALIGAAQGLALELGIPTLELNVMAFNVDARLFFEKSGFMLLREVLFQKVT